MAGMSSSAGSGWQQLREAREELQRQHGAALGRIRGARVVCQPQGCGQSTRWKFQSGAYTLRLLPVCIVLLRSHMCDGVARKDWPLIAAGPADLARDFAFFASTTWITAHFPVEMQFPFSVKRGHMRCLLCLAPKAPTCLYGISSRSCRSRSRTPSMHSKLNHQNTKFDKI